MQNPDHSDSRAIIHISLPLSRLRIHLITWGILIWFAGITSQASPPYVDYCAMLARDIAGKKHGMLCGTTLYYCGGIAGDRYNLIESETLGFTHPFFDDERSRGYGIVEHGTGSGHDGEGWDFYRHVRTAYGTVIVDGRRFVAPPPVQLIWRPDRQVARYEVDGVNIHETKFISQDNVLCAVISSDAPIEIEFAGQSFFKSGHTISSSAEVDYDAKNSALRIKESGISHVWPEFHTGQVQAGRMMYDNLQFVLAASTGFEHTLQIHREESGQQKYSFWLECGDKPLVLAYAAGNERDDVTARVRRTIQFAQREMDAKTSQMNRLLNEQIPYFRCSDKSVVDTYYYLWALYFMYFRDGGGEWSLDPHTSTAINNYRSLFAFDSYAYIPLASWVADKRRWGYGNCTNWSVMLPYRKGNQLPECFGSCWRSPTYVNITGHAAGAWQIYQHSGDQKFLEKMYGFYRELYWDELGFQWGMEVNLASALVKMADKLKLNDDARHWRQMRNSAVNEFRRGWEATVPDFYGTKVGGPKDVWNITSMNSEAMEDGWARRMSRRWIMNSTQGYFGEVPLNIRAKNSPQLPPFVVATLPTYLVVEGMFRHNVDSDALECTTRHLHGMVRDYRFPIAPEAWDSNYKPWGSMYVAWDTSVLLLLIERIAGINYSVVENRFEVNEHLPPNWDFLEIEVPIVLRAKTHWTRVRIDRVASSTSVRKAIQIRECPLHTLLIRPWNEERRVQSFTKTPNDVDHDRNDHSCEFNEVDAALVEIVLGELSD